MWLENFPLLKKIKSIYLLIQRSRSSPFYASRTCETTTWDVVAKAKISLQVPVTRRDAFTATYSAWMWALSLSLSFPLSFFPRFPFFLCLCVFEYTYSGAQLVYNKATQKNPMESTSDENKMMINEPLLKKPPKGGFRTLPFIIGTIPIYHYTHTHTHTQTHTQTHTLMCF